MSVPLLECTSLRYSREDDEDAVGLIPLPPFTWPGTAVLSLDGAREVDDDAAALPSAVCIDLADPVVLMLHWLKLGSCGRVPSVGGRVDALDDAWAGFIVDLAGCAVLLEGGGDCLRGGVLLGGTGGGWCPLFELLANDEAVGEERVYKL